jgi:hypothetical protein
MSAPPLPDTFGNYALGDFVEVVSPAPISWLPQTEGWVWLGVAIAALLGYRTWQALRHWYRNRYRREAAARLQRLAAGSATAPVQVAEVNRLLKLTALAAFSRQQVARLSGQDWVDFLNRQCPAPPFSAEHGNLLALAPYTGDVLEAGRCNELVDACLAWVMEHENPLDD